MLKNIIFCFAQNAESVNHKEKLIFLNNNKISVLEVDL